MRYGRMVCCIGAVALLAGTMGCATRGYVRDRISTLRTEMNETDSSLQSQADENGRLAGSARSRADSAQAQIGSVRDLALGRTDFREVARSRVYFARGGSRLSDEARSVLDGVVAQIRRNPQYVADVYGFADPMGSEEFNFRLGRRRADTAERYLVERVPGGLSRFRSISFGEFVPASDVAALRTTEDRRQVLVVILERVPPTDRTDALTAR